MDGILNFKTLLGVVIGIVIAALTMRFKEEIAKVINFLIDGLLSLARVYFIMLKRYKKSISRSYRETKVGYRNLRLDLDRNYISLKVCSFVSPREKEADEETRLDKLEVLDVLKKHRHLVILGHPGAGKTTLMQWLLLKYVYGHMKEKLGENLIPLFITLRSLEGGQSIKKLLPEILKQHRFKGGVSFIRKQMEKGKCLLIFDGMDEIIDDDTRKKFIADICDTYANLYGKSRIVITTRIEEYPEDCFPASFREREILDLDMAQVHDFVHGILEPRDKPDELIRQIEKSEGLKKFVTNPLMLSLLTFVYRESQQKLPNDRVKVYNQCIQLMMEDRDRSRGIYEYRNQFDSDDKELLLCKLAYDFSLQNKWRYTEMELLENWKKNLPPNLKENDLKKLIKEVCTANGILKHLSGKELSFLHRTFQEYYAAKEICKRGQSYFEKLNDSDVFDQFSKKEWYEITLFLVGMMEDASSLIRNLSNRFPRFALQCLVYARRTTDETIAEVIKRALKTLEKEHAYEAGSNLIYLIHRYGFVLISKCLATALEEARDVEIQKLLWPVIDLVMLAFSPQKQMVYVSAGILQWGNEPEMWVPGFWMDICPVTNADYQAWVEASGIKALPRHWETKPDEEPMVIDTMKLLPIVDISFNIAASFSAALQKNMPGRLQWGKAITNADGGEGLLNENKKKYLRKNKLELSYGYYYFDRDREFNYKFAHTLDLGRARARAFVRALTRALTRALDSDFDLDPDLDLVRVLARDLDLALASALALASDRAFALALDHVRTLALVLDQANIFAHVLTRASTHIRDLGFKKMANHFNTAYEDAKMLEEELNRTGRWTEKTREQLFVLGKILGDTLMIFLEILEKPIPEDLLKALRQPGLLNPVKEFSVNSVGIYDLVGNVWEWTSTTNEKGDHLVCGGAWTEETFDPDKEVWYPPEYRDINLGFRCVCDWDKIMDVKEPGELSRKPLTEEDEQRKIEID